MRFIYFLMMLAAGFAANARDVMGRVCDDGGNSLAGASCVVYTLPDSTYLRGTVSDESGLFRLAAPETGDWFLTVSYIGMESRDIDRKEYVSQTAQGQRLEVALRPATSELGEVVVKARKPQLTLKGEALSYNIDDIMKTRVVSSAHNLLTQLPLIQSRDGNSLELSGAPMGNAVIYINGKQPKLRGSQLTDYLKNIPAEQVKNVEIIYNPSSRWKTRSSVINVVLKRQNAYTANGQVKADAFYKHATSLSGGGSLFAGLPKLNINVMYNYGNIRGKGKEIQDALHTVGDETRHIHDTVTGKVNNLSHTVYTALSYEINSKSSLDLTYNGSFSPRNRQHARQVNSLLGTSVGEGDADRQLNAVSLEYTSPIGLTGGVEYVNHNYDGHEMIDKTSATGEKSPFMRSRSSQHVNRVKVYADGSNSLGRGWTLSYGASYETTNTKNRHTNVSDILNSTTASTTRESIIKGYAGLQRAFFGNRFFASVSASGEHYKIGDYIHNGIFPRATLTFMPSQTHIFQAAYQTFKSYPSFWERMDFVSYSNEYQVNIGNPTLRPADYKVGSLIYVWKNKYVLSSSYYHVKDFFFSQIYLSPDEFLQIQKLFNADLSSVLRFSLTIPLNVKKVWYPTVTLSESLERFKSDDWHGLAFDRRKWSGSVTVNNTFIVSTKPRISLELNGFASTGSMLGLWDRPSNWGVDAGASMSLLKNKLVVSVRGNDLFESQTPMQYMDYGQQRLSVDSRFYGRSLSVSVVYKFKGYKEKQMKSVDTSRYMAE